MLNCNESSFECSQNVDGKKKNYNLKVQMHEMVYSL